MNGPTAMRNLVRMRWTEQLAALVLVAGYGAPLAVAEEANSRIAGVGPVGEIVKVQTGFKFTEGPAADREGNLYFSDVAGDTIYFFKTGGKAGPFLTPSRHANGLMLNGAGELVVCQMDGQLGAIDLKAKTVRNLTDKFDGARYNAPNDLVIDNFGGIYFTDPHFRAPMPLPQGKPAVYYLSTEGKVARLIDDVNAPNGVILSPDEKTLYVIPSTQKEMLAYPVKGPGSLGERRVFCALAQPADSTGPGSGGDGLTVDTKRNLYITSRIGIQVFSPEGKPLGTLVFPEQPANCTFGGADFKTLYVTARTSLYACPMEAQGHVFRGKGP